MAYSESYKKSKAFKRKVGVKKPSKPSSSSGSSSGSSSNSSNSSSGSSNKSKRKVEVVRVGGDGKEISFEEYKKQVLRGQYGKATITKRSGGTKGSVTTRVRRNSEGDLIVRTKDTRTSPTKRVIFNGGIYEVNKDTGAFRRTGLTNQERARRARIKSGTATPRDLITSGANILDPYERARVLGRVRNLELAKDKLERERQTFGPRLSLLSKKKGSIPSETLASFKAKQELSKKGIAKLSSFLSKYGGLRSTPESMASKITTKQANALAKRADAIKKRESDLNAREQKIIAFIDKIFKEKAKQSKTPSAFTPKPLFPNLTKATTKAGRFFAKEVATLGATMTTIMPQRLAQVVDKSVFLGQVGVSRTVRGEFRSFMRSFLKESNRTQPIVQETLRMAFKDPRTYIYALISARTAVKGEKPSAFLSREPANGGKLAKSLKGEAIVTKTALKDRLKVIEFDSAGQIKKVQIINKKLKKVEQVRVKPKKSKKVKFLEYDSKGNLIKSGFVDKLNPKTKSEIARPTPKKDTRVKVYEYNANGRLIKTSFARRISGNKDKLVRTPPKRKVTPFKSKSRVKVYEYNASGRLIKTRFARRIKGKTDKIASVERKALPKKAGQTEKVQIWEYGADGKLISKKIVSSAKKGEKPTPPKPKVDNRVKVYEFDANGNLVKSFITKYKSKVKKTNFVEKKGKVELNKSNVKGMFKSKKGQAQISITKLRRPRQFKTTTLKFKTRKVSLRLKFSARALRKLSVSALALKRVNSLAYLPSSVTFKQLESIISTIKAIEAEILKPATAITSASKNALGFKQSQAFRQDVRLRQQTKQKQKQKPKPKEKPPAKLKIPKFKFNFNSKTLENKVLTFKGSFRERKYPTRRASKSNPIVRKRITLRDTRNRALKRVAERVDNSLSASLDLRVVGVGKAKKDIKLPPIIKKFNLKKSKNTPVLRLVEKNKFRFDKKGEKIQSKILRKRKRGL